MKNKSNVPAIIAGIFTGIIALKDLFSLFDFFDSLDELGRVGGYGILIFIILVAAILITAGFIMATVGLFSGKKETTQKGFMFVVVGSITDFVDIFLLLAVSGGLKYTFSTSESTKAMLMIIICFGLTAAANLMTAETVKIRVYNQSVKSKWFIPSIIYGVSILTQMIILGDLSLSSGLSLDASTNNTGTFQILATLGVFLFTGLAMIYDENPNMFSGTSTGTSSYNNNPYMNQSPYGQQYNPTQYGQQPYGQQPQQPQQPLYNQQTNNYNNQQY